MKTLAARYRQAHKESLWAVGLSIAYFVWWYISAYGFAPADIHQKQPELYFGFPLWFLLSCIIGPLLFTILCICMVKFVYKDMSLEIDTEESEEAPHE